MNENGNDLLRQYFPRGTSFHKITEKMVVEAAERLNNRPRKCLDSRLLLKFLTLPCVVHLQLEYTRLCTRFVL